MGEAAGSQALAPNTHVSVLRHWGAAGRSRLSPGESRAAERGAALYETHMDRAGVRSLPFALPLTSPGESRRPLLFSVGITILRGG